MVPISRIATARLSELGLDEMGEFRVPRTTASDVSLIAGADAMASAAEKHFEVFRAEKLPEDFIEQLREAIAVLKAAIVSRDKHRYRRQLATNTLDLRVRNARKVLAVLTGIVEQRLANRPELVADWRARIRIPRKPGVPRGKAAAGAVLGGRLHWRPTTRSGAHSNDDECNTTCTRLRRRRCTLRVTRTRTSRASRH